MPVEFGLWRVDGKPVRVASPQMPLEERLEELIEADPGMLGRPLLAREDAQGVLALDEPTVVVGEGVERV